MEILNLLTTYMRENLTHNPLFLVGFLLLLGYLIGKAVSMVKLPEISGYIIAGVMVNSFTTGVVAFEMNKSLHVITELAIGLLALSIGSEFSFGKIRKIGKHILVITIFQFLFTFVMVTAALHLFKLEIPYAVILAVTACATAPAIIVAEVHHLKAYGKFVDYLFGTVVLIDALCVVLFGISFTLVTNYLNLSPGAALPLFDSFKEIGLSVVLGVLSGTLIHFLTVRKNNNGEILIITLSIIFITTGMALVYHLSPLLMNIVTGTVLANMSIRNHRLFKLFENFTPPIYALFFVIAGIEIDPGIFFRAGILLIAMVYFLSRFVGKYAGVWIGCRIMNLAPAIRNHLGFCMLSQAGIALGFVLLIQTSPIMAKFGENSVQRVIFTNMMNVVLISIFINEIIGPVLSRYAIIKGNQMDE